MPNLPSISEKYEQLVFTHPSASLKGEGGGRSENYDRLEFLGDAHIEIIASQIIFENHPDSSAGSMCRLRESVVKNDTLSQYSIHYGFDKKLRCAAMPTGGTKAWTKIYGDVFEAYAAAIVLSDPENGQKTLKTWLEELWSPILREVEVKLPDVQLKGKEELARAILCPNVRIEYVEERKPIVHVGSGRESYFMGVYFEGWGYKNQHLGSAEAHNRNVAGNDAAMNALNNHPLIDNLITQKKAYMAQKEAEKQKKAMDRRGDT